jgi:hypothetical protein
MSGLSATLVIFTGLAIGLLTKINFERDGIDAEALRSATEIQRAAFTKTCR